MEILRQESAMDCVTEMRAADAWIREQASRNGLLFRNRR